MRAHVNAMDADGVVHSLLDATASVARTCCGVLIWTLVDTVDAPLTCLACIATVGEARVASHDRSTVIILGGGRGFGRSPRRHQ